MYELMLHNNNIETKVNWKNWHLRVSLVLEFPMYKCILLIVILADVGNLYNFLFYLFFMFNLLNNLYLLKHMRFMDQK